MTKRWLACLAGGLVVWAFSAASLGAGGAPFDSLALAQGRPFDSLRARSGQAARRFIIVTLHRARTPQ